MWNGYLGGIFHATQLRNKPCKLLPLPRFNSDILLLIEHLIGHGIDSAKLSILSIKEQSNLLQARSLGLRGVSIGSHTVKGLILTSGKNRYTTTNCTRIQPT